MHVSSTDLRASGPAATALVPANVPSVTARCGTTLPAGATLDHPAERYVRAAALLQPLLHSPAMVASVEKGLRLLLNEPDRCRVAGPTLQVWPARQRPHTQPYTVGATCTCQDARFRAKQHGGFCKHLAAFCLVVIVNRYDDAALQQLSDQLTPDLLPFHPKPAAPPPDEEALASLEAQIFAAVDAGDDQLADALAAHHSDPAGVRLFLAQFQTRTV